MENNIAIIGYSGHGFVAVSIFKSMGREVIAYCDSEEKSYNPFKLQYLGQELDNLELLKAFDYFVSVGNNKVRKNIYHAVLQSLGKAANAIHNTAFVDPTVSLMDGIFIAANASINPLTVIGTGAICNTGSIIDHECQLGEFAHIGPGAVLCGGVKIGNGSFIGANAVVKEGVIIGENVMIGAGATVIRNVEDNKTVVGNPQKEIIKY